MTSKKFINVALYGTIIFCLVFSAVCLKLAITQDKDGFASSTSSEYTTTSSSLSPYAVELHDLTDITTVPPVGQLYLANPNGEPDRQEGVCTATVVKDTEVVTANHCIVGMKEGVSAVFTPLLHTDSTGQVIRPYGQCMVSVPLGAQDKNPADDYVFLTIDSCSDDQGEQQTSLANIGSRIGTLGTGPVSQSDWYSAKGQSFDVRAYGYPRVSYDSPTKDSCNSLYQLDTKPASSSWYAKTNLGGNALIIRDSLDRGASGGPILIVKNHQSFIASVISRKENAETTGVYTAMSGASLPKVGK